MDINNLRVNVVAYLILITFAFAIYFVMTQALGHDEDAKLLVSLLTLVISSYFLICNYQNSIRSNSAKMVVDFSARLDSPQMRGHRKRLAKQLLFVRRLVRESESKSANRSYAHEAGMENDCPFLDFIEDIGYLTKIGVLDKDMVWNSFIWVVERYYLAVTRPHNLLNEMRSDDYTELYERFEWLYREIVAIDRSRRKNRSLSRPDLPDPYEPSSDAIDRFLEDESNLD